MSGSEEGFQWFGEGFDGFPRGLPEDCVEYTLYVIDATLQDDEVRRKLRDVQASANVLTKQLLKGFIWQRERFKLELARENGMSFLRGRTNYGDSVDDEWLIVFILRQLSRQHTDVWIRAVDTDGQFLMIEAANHLPRWVNPDVAEFRVWINQGKLLIIPQDSSTEDSTTEKVPVAASTLHEAQRFLKSDRSQLLHLLPVEEEAFYRLQKFPEQIRESLHSALVTIPRKLAYVLHKDQSYISPATEAFYLRDPIALRPLHASNTANLVFAPDDMVTVSVKFTKVGYAQFKSQQFPTPTSWQTVLTDDRNEKSQVRLETGMKVTCGFEMLMADPQNKDKREVREIGLLLEDLDTNQEILPSDTETALWPQEDDDERWLDVNFEDFGKELDGHRVDNKLRAGSGLGDNAVQDNLRRMVAKVQEFIQDDEAGIDGAEYLDELDEDDTEDDKSSQRSDIESSSKDVDFREEDFTAMLKQMVGISPSDSEQSLTSVIHSFDIDLDPTSDTDEGEEKMREAMQTMEHELRDAGALRRLISREVASHPSSTNQGSTGHGPLTTALNTADDGANRDLDIDVTLAENLLASLKGQAGKAGPVGNLAGLLGMHMPRDEDDDLAFSNELETPHKPTDARATEHST